MEMNLTRTKLIGAVILTFGLLAVGIGPAVAPWASAQTAPKYWSAKPNQPAAQSRPPESAKWEYAYIEVPGRMKQSTFETQCRTMESGGWEFCGTLDMTLDQTGDKSTTKNAPGNVLVFKRLATAQRVTVGVRMEAAGQTEADMAARVDALVQELVQLRAAEKDHLPRPSLPGQAMKQRDTDLPATEKMGKGQPHARAVNEATKAWNDLAQYEKAKKNAPDNSVQRGPTTANDPQRNTIQGEPPARDAGWGRSAKVADSIAIMPLEEASAEKTAKLITELFGNQGTFQADERSNSLVIKTDAKTLEEVRNLIERLDKQARMRSERDKVRYQQKN